MFNKRAKINWAKALADPRDYELLQQDKLRRAHANAWKESSDERDGRVCHFSNSGGAALLTVGYDHRAELLDAVAPSTSTLRAHANRARHNRGASAVRGINRHAAGGI